MTKNTQKDNNSQQISLDELAKIKDQLKNQILDELKDQQTLKQEEAKKRRAEEKAEQEKYFETMKKSPDPWVEIVGWVHTNTGVQVELEWNDAFVNYLRSNGVSGSSDEQVVQKWVTLLLRDMADQMDENNSSDFS